MLQNSHKVCVKKLRLVGRYEPEMNFYAIQINLLIPLKQNNLMEKKPIKEDLMADNTCTICLDMFYKPSKLPCGHYFCIHCLRNWMKKNRICPNCRAEIPEDFTPKVLSFG